MEKYNIEKFIEFVADLVNEFDIFYEREIDSRFYFLHGGSYELYKVVKHYFKEAECVISKDLNHCAILYNGEIYDIIGKIVEKEKYRLIEDLDIIYMENIYNTNINDLRDEKIIQELDKCHIKGILYQ